MKTNVLIPTISLGNTNNGNTDCINQKREKKGDGANHEPNKFLLKTVKVKKTKERK